MPLRNRAPSVTLRPDKGIASTDVKWSRLRSSPGFSQGSSESLKVLLCSTA